MRHAGVSNQRGCIGIYSECGVGGVFRCKPRVAHRSPPCRFSAGAICLILRRCGREVGEHSEPAELEARRHGANALRILW